MLLLIVHPPWHAQGILLKSSTLAAMEQCTSGASVTVLFKLTFLLLMAKSAAPSQDVREEAEECRKTQEGCRRLRRS